MENQNKSLLLKSLQYGAITGIVFIVITLLIYVLNINMISIGFGILIFIINAGIMITAMVFGIKHVRDKIFGETLIYGKRFLVGFIIGLIGTWISVIFSFIFFKYFDPDYLPGQVENFAEKLIEWGVPEEDAWLQEEKMTESLKPLNQLKNGLIKLPLIYGGVSLIISAFVKKNRVSAEDKVL